MIETQEVIAPACDQIGVLARDFQARIVNYSLTGCLLETNCRLEVGTVGTLRVVINGRELEDDVQIVRCQPIEGAGSLFQVGARFLWTSVPPRHSIRLTLTPPNGARAIPADG
jgi:hypothetical protein